MYLVISVVYRITDNASVGRSKVFDINREYDFQLYKINENTAFVVSRTNTVSVASYKQTIFPFCFLCGNFEINGTIVNVIEFIKDDWVYTKNRQPFYEGYNLKSGKTFDIPEEIESTENLDPERDVTLELKEIKEYKTRNLTFSEEEKLDVEFVFKNFEKLSTLNESCLIFNAAFLIVIFLYLVFGLVYFLFFRRK